LTQKFPSAIPLPDTILPLFNTYVEKQQQQLNTINMGVVQALSLN
jgi:hypothetical protein